MTKLEHNNNNMKSKLANVVGGKSARACDNCVRKRARWYCAADDAFLCQSCDSSVHSANPLALRHERVRLKTSSVPNGSDDEDSKNQSKPNQNSVPSCCWHNGFTKKARTPRHNKHAKGILNHPLRLVPEISSEDNNSNEDNEEQLLYRVPVFDSNPNQPLLNRFSNYDQSKANEVCQDLHNFLPTEMDLADFAADVESLLGTGLENESFDILLDSERVKSEQEELQAQINHQNEFDLIDIGRETTFELSFDYEEEEEEKDIIKASEIGVMMNDLGSCSKVDESKRNMLLRLDYQSVISAWDDQKSPWTTGERPELDDSTDCWPACMGTCGRIHVCGDMGPIMGGHVAVVVDGGREARVSRYREKRRTRLFSKKIRYEVRKLNAEKRPRMKGRFVKRASLVATGLPLLKT